ncbi:imidazoleglycerol-phosphate dehydratase HisB [Neisseria leonii]|uniref:Imidazoleglycerol-phosphate dehydratase n=1 Tax=Neisseria leonii TaxID=2995413 RepID=A0A9X4E2J8_9NEIS|nr:imidazoleglycerol-phosphate dehydratase HisB [Neisseria sp. 51.81]MDD9326791.1 imidazoleglycerol-phosphate dehydratase HisB [Neisseria sp. 51.81]
MDKKSVRRDNFFKLVEEAGNVSKLARACGYNNPASLHQLSNRLKKNEEGSRGITNSLALKLERGMGKPKGWLDRVHREKAPVAETAAEPMVQTVLPAAAEGARVAAVSRHTSETQVDIRINLDGSGRALLDTGVPFLNHMLDQIARHSLIDLEIRCQGDLHIDDHHTVEDIGITLGQALKQALGDKRGICRYGHAYVPLDEALSRVVIDLSGRPGLVYNIEYTRAVIGRFDVDLLEEFFHGLVNHSMMTLHIDNLSGKNAHHQAETVFKAFGRALRMAVEYDARMAGQTPSTKGTLTA